MNFKSYFRQLQLISFLFFFMGSNTYAQFVHTFSECLYVHDGDVANSDTQESLYGGGQDLNGDYHFFGIGVNEAHLSSAHQNSNVIQYLNTNRAGVIQNNQVIGLDDPNLRTIENLEYRHFDMDACGSQDWILTTEVANNTSQVRAYLLDPGFQPMNNINVSENLGSNHQHKVRDFIRNDAGEMVWVGSVHTYNGHYFPTLGFSQDGCGSWWTRLYAAFDDVLHNGQEGVATSIVELNPGIMGAQYAVTGSMGINVFCLLLDANFDIVDAYLYDIDASIQSREEAVKIQQTAAGSLVIVGNKMMQSGPGYADDGIFVLELDLQMNISQVNMVDLVDVCERVYDFEIDDLGHYILVGQESTACDQSTTAGFAFMVSVGPGAVGHWIYRFHENNTVGGSLFRDVELVQDVSGTGLAQQYVAMGSCRDENDPTSTNHDFFLVKTDENGKLLESDQCQEVPGLDVLYEDNVARLDISPTIEEFSVDPNPIPELVQGLQDVSTFCDFHAECCEGTQRIFSQRYQATIEVTGCQEVTARLDETDDCWQVTWFWGDGTSDGPMPTDLNPIVHQYQDGCLDNALVMCFVEELDGNGNSCFLRTGTTQIVFRGPNLLADGTFDWAWNNNGTLDPSVFSVLNRVVCPTTMGSGQYSISNGNNLPTCNPGWCAISNGSNTDPYMACDPGNAPSTLWQQTFAVTPGANYNFCGDLKNLVNTACCTNPTITIQINGANILTIPATSLPVEPCNVWRNFNFNWNAGTNNMVVLGIISNTTTRSGGDLGIDNLFFGQCLDTGNTTVLRSSEEQKEGPVSKRVDEEKVDIYPNPASSVVHFEFGHTFESRVEIFALNGQRMGTFVSDQQRWTIDVQSWNPGIYIVKIFNPDTGNISSHKVVVQ